MKRAFWGSLLLVVVTAAALVTASGASAASAPGFNIITSPLPIKLLTTPGKTISTELRMKNQSDKPEAIKVGLMKFGATGENGEPDLFSLTPSDSYASWVHFSPSRFVAQPGIWQTVKMTINVPSNASLGYYLAVTFSRANTLNQQGVTNLNGSVATLVLLNVNTPNEKRTLSIASFTADHKLYEYLPANFSIRLHNSGNIYIAPAGNIFISRGGKQVASLEFNPAGGSVLPNSNRVFTQPWSDGFPVFKPANTTGKPVLDKHGQPKLHLSWDFGQLGKFRFGHYTAKLLVVYNNGRDDVPLQASLSFWVIPWKLLLILIIFLVIIGFGLWSLLRSGVRKTRAGVSRVQKLRRHDKD
ncbi:MAG TPA: hypothetical protein VG992_03930 [Candidatus Saccharimonadales bacterium]|nr:hypothetical protein [Candidatus Saccharimonadales bacterium]